MTLLKEILEHLPLNQEEALTNKELFDKCKSAVDASQVSTMLCQMHQRGEIERVKNSDSSICKFRYYKRKSGERLAISNDSLINEVLSNMSKSSVKKIEDTQKGFTETINEISQENEETPDYIIEQIGTITPSLPDAILSIFAHLPEGSALVLHQGNRIELELENRSQVFYLDSASDVEKVIEAHKTLNQFKHSHAA